MSDIPKLDNSTSVAPLAGVRVLETAILYAGPLVATFLADQGADVIKVEPPDGDTYRTWDAMWSLVGRNKRSITLNTRESEGQQILRDLLPHVDVIVENLPVAIAEKRGLTPAQMRDINPALVVVSASGFGPDGPYADRPANGTIGEAFAGLTNLTGDADGPPQLPAAPLGDAIAAAFGAMGALAGVVRALKTGEGAYVDLTVHEPLLHTLGMALPDYRPGEPAANRDGGAMGVPMRGTFATNDGGWIAISASTPRHIEAISTLSTAGRSPNEAVDNVRDQAKQWISQNSRETVLDALVNARVPASAVNDLEDVFSDPHIAHRGSLLPIGQGHVAGPTPRIDGSILNPTLPDLGNANASIYRDLLNMDPATLKRLEDASIV